jgi:hypothetical protein
MLHVWHIVWQRCYVLKTANTLYYQYYTVTYYGTKN